MNYRFSDLVDLQRLRQMLDAVHAAFGLGGTVADADGTLLVRAGWQDICALYHRACPATARRCEQSDRFIREHLSESSYIGYQCLNGLRDYATPVMINGQHLATVYTGQFLNESPDMEFFRCQAREFGFDEQAYLAALARVPIIPEERLPAIMAFFTGLAESLASAGIQQMQLAEASAVLEKRDVEIKRINEDLEQRVALRTAELASANRELSQREAALSATTAGLEAEVVEREATEAVLLRANTELVRAEKRTSRVLDALQAASGSLEIKQVLRRIASELVNGTEISHCILYYVDENLERLVPQAIVGRLNAQQRAFLKRAHSDLPDPSLIRLAAQSKKPVISPDVESDPRADRRVARVLGIRSALAVPIQRGDRVLGVALAYTIEAPHNFTAEEIELAVGMGQAVALAIENAELYEETRRRLAESESFNRLIVSLLQETRLEDVLDIVCTEARRLTGATASTILLHVNDAWQVAHCQGDPPPVVDRLAADGSLAGLSMQRGEPVFVDDPANHLHAYGASHLTSLCAVPLQVNDATIGVLDMVNMPYGPTQEDIRIMRGFANQAAVAIEHARLQKDAEQLAVFEERQRLARELHDSVTQSLYSLTLYASAASRALRAGRQEVTAGYLQEIECSVHESMRDMRMLIFELHPPELETEGLASVVQERLAAVESRAGLQTDFQVEGHCRLPLVMEQELYGIAQEALNNVLKHARASQVAVHLQIGPESASLEVCDNGQGFDRSAVQGCGGVGLRNMAERAARMDGRLTLDSRPGRGTRVRVDVQYQR